MTIQRFTHPATDVELAVRRTLTILFLPFVGSLLWFVGTWSLCLMWWADWGNRIGCFVCVGLLGWCLPAGVSYGVVCIFQRVLEDVQHKSTMAELDRRMAESRSRSQEGWH